MSGHSHWAKIKRAKGSNDAKRGKVWSKIARKIIIAARSGGGDPRENLTLRYTIEEARAENMPKDTIEKAIDKGTGASGEAEFESLTYEGYGPHGVAFLVEVLTNNRSRTAPEMRKMFEVVGGNMGNSGSVAFQFVKQGLIYIKSDAIAEDKLIELALDAGAEDVRSSEDGFEVVTAPGNFHKVREALLAAKLPIEGAEITNVPLNTVPVNAEAAAKILRFIETLEDHEDVQTVSHNAEIPESVGE